MQVCFKAIIYNWIPILLLLANGCAEPNEIATYPVSGKVVFSDGSPLRGGTVLCVSDTEPKAYSARGQIAEDGTFRLGTFAQDDGAVAGQHQAAIIPAMPEGFDPDSGSSPNLISRRFEQYETSGLQFEVAADKENEIVLQVSR